MQTMHVAASLVSDKYTQTNYHNLVHAPRIIAQSVVLSVHYVYTYTCMYMYTSVSKHDTDIIGHPWRFNTCASPTCGVYSGWISLLLLLCLSTSICMAPTCIPILQNS